MSLFPYLPVLIIPFRGTLTHLRLSRNSTVPSYSICIVFRLSSRLPFEISIDSESRAVYRLLGFFLSSVVGKMRLVSVTRRNQRYTTLLWPEHFELYVITRKYVLATFRYWRLARDFCVKVSSSFHGITLRFHRNAVKHRAERVLLFVRREYGKYVCVCVCVYKQKVSFQSRGIDVHLLNEKFSVGSRAAIKRLTR